MANKDINEKRASASNRMLKAPPIRIESLRRVTAVKNAGTVEGIIFLYFITVLSLLVNTYILLLLLRIEKALSSCEA